MIILSIETSCDETAVSILGISGKPETPRIKILGNFLSSQTKIHAKYGGVYPHLAKREHSKNLIPVLKEALNEAKMLKKRNTDSIKEKDFLQKTELILNREPELLKSFQKFIPTIMQPSLDLIAVTAGPGLEPALWVGINFAQALGNTWNLPVIPINHMEGHFLSILYNPKHVMKIKFPALALLISGGHTELVYAKKPFEYKKIGATRDDAVGEAYDKVARMLDLGYPGGVEISKLAQKALKRKRFERIFNLPRPMLQTDNFDFSFSGLKTAVRYSIKDKKLSAKEKEMMSLEFENAVIDVLTKKTEKALRQFLPRTFIVAGGVAANTRIKEALRKTCKDFTNTNFLAPQKSLATDNSVMIGIAAYGQMHGKSRKKRNEGKKIVADGNLTFSS